MINIDNLDGEGTIFITTDDGTKSIGHVEEEYVDIMQDVVKAYHFYTKEIKRLRVLLNGIVDIALKQTLLNDDNPPMVNILNIAYEGVVE